MSGPVATWKLPVQEDVHDFIHHLQSGGRGQAAARAGEVHGLCGGLLFEGRRFQLFLLASRAWAVRLFTRFVAWPMAGRSSAETVASPRRMAVAVMPAQVLNRDS